MDTKDVVSCIAAANVNRGGVKGNLRHHHDDNAQDGSDTPNNNDSTDNNQPTRFVSARCPSQQGGDTLLLVAGIVCGMGADRVAHAGDEVEAAAVTASLGATATGGSGKRKNGDHEINAVANSVSDSISKWCGSSSRKIKQ